MPFQFEVLFDHHMLAVFGMFGECSSVWDAITVVVIAPHT
jgi:hypothetical protein